MDNEEKTNGNQIHVMSAETATIRDRLMLLEIGERVPYAELSELIGRDVQHEARYVMDSARRICLRNGIVIGVGKPGESLQRLRDIEIIDDSRKYIDRTRRTAFRARRRLASVKDFDSLPEDKKMHHNLFMSIFGALHRMTSSATLKKIEGKVMETKKELPVAKTLDAFLR